MAQVEEGGAAAVDGDDGTGHEEASSESEEGDGGGDLADVGLPAERLQRGGGFAGGEVAAASSGVIRVRRWSMSLST